MCIIIYLNSYVPYALDHCLLGVIIVQISAILFSSYPSAINTLSFESTPIIIPLIHTIVDDKNLSLEEKCVTIIIICTLVSLISGSLLYIIGRVKIASIVENIPLCVKSGIFAAIGYVWYNFFILV